MLLKREITLAGFFRLHKAFRGYSRFNGSNKIVYTAVFGVVAGVVWWINTSTSAAFFGGSCYRFWGSKQLFKKLWFPRVGILSGFLMGCLSALAWVGERRIERLFCIILVIMTALVVWGDFSSGCSYNSYYVT